MKILLTMNLPYTRVYGGANRSNRSLAETLAAKKSFSARGGACARRPQFDNSPATP